jgi:hypothetical protein
LSAHDKFHSLVDSLFQLQRLHRPLRSQEKEQQLRTTSMPAYLSHSPLWQLCIHPLRSSTKFVSDSSQHM